MARKKLNVVVKSYKRKGGTNVRGHSKKVPDKGELGRTPKSKRWFKPERESGWKKSDPQYIRIRKTISSRPKNWSERKRTLSAMRSINALANVTTDKKTEMEARSDVKVLRRRL